MSEDILFEEKDNKAWIPRNAMPARTYSKGVGAFAGTLSLTNEYFIFKPSSPYGSNQEIKLRINDILSVTIAEDLSSYESHGRGFVLTFNNKNNSIREANPDQLLGGDRPATVLVFRVADPQKWLSKLRTHPEKKRKDLESAKKHEELLDFEEAAKIYKEYEMDDEVVRVRKLKAEQGAVKVDQTVIHGDYVDDRDTIVKDSVINKSNIGAGGDDKFAKLKELKEMLAEGLIDKDDFNEMKKEILGK